MNKERTDVVIAGGGLTGYTLAALLAQQGVSSTIIEFSATQHSGEKDPRALSITPGTQRILSKINAWQYLSEEKIGRFEKIHVWDDTNHGDIMFDCCDVSSPVLGYIIEQSVLQEALGKLVAAATNIKLVTDTSISAYSETTGKVVCELSDGNKIESRLLVGADGINSRVRDLAGLALERFDYNQKAVACLVDTQQPHEKIARQRFLKDGPVAFLPLKQPDRCGVVWSNRSDQADFLLAMDDQEFCLALEEAFGSRLGKILRCESRLGFNLQRSRVLNYFNGSCVLIGDAAHTVHPLAGQGANMGITDAAVLSQLILAAKSGGKDYASRHVLRKYERWRKTENNKMTLIMEGIKNIFEDDKPQVSLLRGNGMMLVNRSSIIKNKIMKYAMGLSGDVPTIVSGSQFEELSNAG